jgi:DNA-binding NarL/FixJ family response regulator
MYHDTATVPDGCFSSVLIVDDHPLYSDALAAALGIVFADCAVQKAGTLKEAMTLLKGGLEPDLVMFDLKLPDVTGISGFLELRDRMASTPILVISSLASVELVRTLMREGAAGFLPKDASAKVLASVLTEIASGRKYFPKDILQSAPQPSDPGDAAEMNPRFAELTPQQKRIMKLICAGKPNKQIAYELSLAEATVKAHITALLRRLGVQNRTQAAVMMENAMSGTMGADPEAQAFLSR